ncbi:hypothetical protein [Endozoicomonas sp. ALC020]|uniref:hypothetical protein n=1 Tax=unclassified Endozoicomonas TaxID=2644528 RepID=UPI003BAEF820
MHNILVFSCALETENVWGNKIGSYMKTKERYKRSGKEEAWLADKEQISLMGGYP